MNEIRVQQSYDVLDRLRLPNGMYYASPSVDYSYVWLRDSFYMSLAYLSKTCDTYERTYHRILDMFKEYEWKIDYHVQHKPIHQHEYIHARYSAHDVKEIDSPWGHSQNDSIGSVVWGIGEGLKKGKRILRNEEDRKILQKIVKYLETLEFWNDEDSGMWEEIREKRSSSIGACVAGLKNVRGIVLVSQEIIDKGMNSLYELFPYETPTRKFDLAQLSLIYPFKLFGTEISNVIIKQVERNLLRDRGVIRYEGDSYYSTLEKEHGRGRSRDFYLGTEAEWTFGLPWLALCHAELGNTIKAKRYISICESVMMEDGSLPELYYSKTDKSNPNSPLGWSNSMYILAKERHVQLVGER